MWFNYLWLNDGVNLIVFLNVKMVELFDIQELARFNNGVANVMTIQWEVTWVFTKVYD